MRKLSLLLVVLLSCLLSIDSQATQSDDTVTFYVTRHGKTMFNTVHRAQGWSDTPLTASGIEVAEQLGRGLKNIDFISVYSSDLGRARQTARIVLSAKGVTQPIIESEDLREACFGIFEGDLDPNMWGPAAKHLGYSSDKALMADMAAGKVDIKTSLDAIAAVDTSGLAEDFTTIQSRYMRKMQDIAEKTAKQGGGNVLVISHGIALMVLINSIPDTPNYNELLKNASMTKIIYKNGQFYLDGKPGDMSYVEKGMLP